MPFPPDKSSVLFSLAAPYLIWTGFSVTVMAAGHFLPQAAGPTVGTVSVIGFLVVASALTSHFIVRAEPVFRNRPGLRKISLLTAGCISAALFFLSRQTGYVSDLTGILNTANLLVLANLLGCWITAPLRRPAELIPLCLVMSLADLFSVAAGPTREIAKNIDQYYKSGMQGPVPVTDFILIKIVIPGQDSLMPVFGVADWIIVAFLSAAALRFGMNDNLAGKGLGEMVRRNRLSFYLPIAVPGLFAASALAWHLKIFLPALPVIALFFLAYTAARYPKVRQLTPSDWKLMGATACVMISLMAARYCLLG
ncbi:hypothetical protein DENIS_2619 [Desulfonema ishimotonii]|uniref:Uncharacterized protein n=1 Tax=Desulfonema ishimotonii TaxID=45657 RepID=A0A401FXF3_9BACT|nr:hypothetical protein [Desulfonema ishimotonii]GBC61657.1 hypothetical protein DENIS_2619 [Desulfonema ishimotonii]